MKKMRLKLLALFCAFFVVYSCNEPLVTDNLEDDSIELKSASVEKKTYIVVVDDVITSYSIHYTKLYDKLRPQRPKTKTNRLLQM